MTFDEFLEELRPNKHRFRLKDGAIRTDGANGNCYEECPIVFVHNERYRESKPYPNWSYVRVAEMIGLPPITAQMIMCASDIYTGYLKHNHPEEMKIRCKLLEVLDLQEGL